jgi:hypothetical protein
MTANPYVDPMGICYRHSSYGCGPCDEGGRLGVLAAWEACGGAGLRSGPLISRRLAAGFYTPPGGDWAEKWLEGSW